MVQSLELVLDEDGDHAVREQWRLLHDAGLPSLGDHRGATNRPHVTLSVATSVPEHVEERSAVAADGLPVPLLLGPVVVLGGRRLVLARLVVPTVDLLQPQAGVAAVWADAEGVPATALPGRWIPHVTLATGWDAAQLGRGVQVLRDVTGPVAAGPDGEDGEDGRGLRVSAVGARRWDGQARRTWPVGGVPAG